jgi:hypothetical protein
MRGSLACMSLFLPFLYTSASSARTPSAHQALSKKLKATAAASPEYVQHLRLFPPLLVGGGGIWTLPHETLSWC